MMRPAGQASPYVAASNESSPLPAIHCACLLVPCCVGSAWSSNASVGKWTMALQQHMPLFRRLCMIYMLMFVWGVLRPALCFLYAGCSPGYATTPCGSALRVWHHLWCYLDVGYFEGRPCVLVVCFVDYVMVYRSWYSL